MGYEAFDSLRTAADRLRQVYSPTRKYPALARPRFPQNTVSVVEHLRTAVTALTSGLATADLDEDTQELGASILEILDQLQRNLRVAVPAPAGN
ncbi:hypothetical protein [Kitasatospora sp. P5_F3]